MNRREVISTIMFPIKSTIVSFVKDFLTYSTIRSATIMSSRVGIVYRIAQILILIYLIGYDLILKKGYQSFDQIQSVVTTKVKGQGYVPNNKTKDLNRNDLDYYQKLYELKPGTDYRVLDTAGLRNYFILNFLC